MCYEAKIDEKRTRMKDDTISRQAALHALKVAYWDNDIQAAKDDPCVIDAMTDWAIRQIKALPSAESFSQKEKLKMRVDSEDLFPYLPQNIKDKNTEIAKVYQEGYEQGKKDAEQQARWEHYEHREPRYDIMGVKTWAEAYKCSNCGFIHSFIEDFGHYAFCPNCGAKIDEVAE